SRPSTSRCSTAPRARRSRWRSRASQRSIARPPGLASSPFSTRDPHACAPPPFVLASSCLRRLRARPSGRRSLLRPLRSPAAPALLARRPWAGESTRQALDLAVSGTHPDFVRFHAVRLLESAPKWQQAIAWLQILHRVTGPTRDRSLEELARWNRLFNRSSV